MTLKRSAVELFMSVQETAGFLIHRIQAAHKRQSTTERRPGYNE
jgi:hypothetical protein